MASTMLTQLQPLIRLSITRTYSAGATILYQGEVPRSAYVISSGTVRVLSISAQGDEQIVTYHVAGEFFPTSWIFEKTSSALFFYEASEDCEIALIPRQELITYMTAQPERVQSFLNYFTTSYTASLIRISALEQPKAREKLLYTLYYLCQRHGRWHGKYVDIELSLTHQNLAGLVGLTRETTATEISKLRAKKILNYEKQHYIVNTEKLFAMLGEDSLKSLQIRT